MTRFAPLHRLRQRRMGLARTRGAAPAAAPATAIGAVLALGLKICFVLYCAMAYDGAASADLRAWWLASESHANGWADQIYPPDSTVFTMRPPPEWQARTPTTGKPVAIYPYIYPPIWAGLGAALTRTTDFATIEALASLLNPLLICAMLLLARRATGSSLSQPGYLLLGLALIAGTLVGWAALYENQPQIVVGFLILLAVERDVAGRQGQAGAVLALAAALKVYPALFALVWLATGRWRALGAFALIGGLLAGLSVQLMGWPLHGVFLDKLRVISGSVMVTGLNFNLDTLLAQSLWPEGLTRIRPVSSDPLRAGNGWLVMQKGALWALASKGAMLAVPLALGFRLVRSSAAGGRAFGWGAVMAALALVSPLSWGYHYLAPAAFAPALIDRLGARVGLALIGAAFLPIAIPMLKVSDALLPSSQPLQLAGTVGMVVLAVALGWAASSPRGANGTNGAAPRPPPRHQGLRPSPTRL